MNNKIEDIAELTLPLPSEFQDETPEEEILYDWEGNIIENE